MNGHASDVACGNACNVPLSLKIIYLEFTCRRTRGGGDCYCIGSLGIFLSKRADDLA